MTSESKGARPPIGDPKDAADQKTGGPFSKLFPPEPAVWREARRMVTDKNIRVEDLALCAAQDPALVIELLRTANAMYFSAGRPPISTTKTAIIRLGSEVVVELLTSLKERPQIAEPAASHWFEIHRSRCKRAAIVARMLSESIAKNFSDDCHTAALMLYVGEMLAVFHLGDQYVKIATENSLSAVNYRLQQDFKFDVERMGLSYLHRQGVPDVLLFAIDREARTRSQERAITKPLCLAAGEMIEAFDLNRWEKIAPGKQLNPKSAIRMLQMSESQYLRLYERASEYLFAARIQEERAKAQPTESKFGPEDDGPINNSLEAEIASILDEPMEELGPIEIPTAPPPAPEPELKAKPAARTAAPASAPKSETPAASKPKSKSAPARGSLESALDDFNLSNAKEPKKRARTEEKTTPLRQPLVLKTANGEAVVSSLNNILESTRSSEDLLKQIMEMLVGSGPFEKSALLVVSRDKSSAMVVAARGPNIGNGQRIDISDPLSPLAQCFSKVQSFGTSSSKVSPWGSKAFAVAPIDADHDTPVALYADCGKDMALTFEARRIFRTVIELLNERLPQVPGGIPVEV
jgi:HD-like signal output (HDOD) protein